MGRDALRGGVLRVVRDHRSPEGLRVAEYMRGLIAPFMPTPTWPWENGADKPKTLPRPPASIRESARTAGRLLLDEETLIAKINVLRQRPRAGKELRRAERRLLSLRGMRLGIERSLAEQAKLRRSL